MLENITAGAIINKKTAPLSQAPLTPEGARQTQRTPLGKKCYNLVVPKYKIKGQMKLKSNETQGRNVSFGRLAVNKSSQGGVGARVWSPLPPVPRKDPARDKASEAPRAGWGSAGFSGLISGVRMLTPALSGGRPGFRGGSL